jgi:hypothetical protein
MKVNYGLAVVYLMYNYICVPPGQLSRYSDCLRAGRSDDRGSIPVVPGNFSLQHCVQTGSGVHPISYPMGTRGSFSGDKAAEK